MAIKSTDKLLVGRDGASYQTTFDDSGIPTKDNLDEHLHKTAGGTVVGNTQYTGDITLDDHIATKGYVDSVVPSVDSFATTEYVDNSIPEVPDVSGFATTEYVDQEISNLGDLLVFKGTIDFTTTAAPTEFAVGHVYANSVAGTPDPTWGLTGDVSVGDLYGRGENQWGVVGSTQSEIGDFLPLTGGKMTGDIDMNSKKLLSLGGKTIIDFSALSLNGSSGAALSWDSSGGYLKAAGSASLRWNDEGLTLYSGKAIKLNSEGTEDDHVVTKGYVDGYAMPKNLNTLPALQ